MKRIMEQVRTSRERVGRSLGRGVCAGAALVATLVLTGPVAEASPANAAAAPLQDDAALLSYARVGTKGATARNLYDQQGLAVLEIPAGTILAVHGKRSGWLEVEVPGGFKVWVFGEYVRPASDAGFLQITGDHVRMRPRPSSGPESLPLRQLLSRGDRVRMIGRNDASLDLRQDWVQIWSPAGARAWVREDQTVALAEGSDGSKLWAAAAVGVANRPAKAVPVPATAPAKAAAQPAAAEARKVTDLMKTADDRLRAERVVEETGGTPNYTGVIAAYEAVLATSDNGPTADVARGRIQLARSYQDAYQLRLDLEAEKANLEGALARRDAERAAARQRGEFEGRFGSRGWLEATPNAKGEKVWILHWSGERVAEVVCTSGRYDLGVFAGYEIGIDGAVLRGPMMGSNDTIALPRQVDVRRIEVLSGRRSSSR